MAKKPNISPEERQRRSDAMKARNAAKAAGANLPATEPSPTVLACAKAAHEANRAYCEALGDTSQVAWDEAPDWQRSSALQGVMGVLAGNNAEQSHESWLKQKTEDGWKFGPVKDPDKKEHPCMVPYAELPEEQRRKDEIFVATVSATARALGLMPDGVGVIHEAAPVSEAAVAQLRKGITVAKAKGGEPVLRAIDSVKLTLDHGFSDGAGRRITVEHRISPADWASICRRLGVDDLADHEISALLSFGKAPQG